jgi:hypothetical protein
MSLQNRVDPAGTICFNPARGEFMGNRGGALHSADQRIVRTQKSRSWIICLTEFKGRKRKLMQPGRYTELFFLDEVTALAAGHRPCFECRRKEAILFAEAFGRSRGIATPKAPVMDERLAAERKRSADAPERIIASRAVSSLPDGAMIRQGATYHALRGAMLLQWSFDGYGAPVAVSSLEDSPIYLATPPSTLEALSQGYRPAFHSRAWIPDT